MPEDHWSRNEGPVRISERPTGVSDERSEEFRRSVKESLNGPFQANRSDGTKPGIGIERKNKPTFSVNMYIKSGYFKSNFPISFLTMMQEIRLICL